MRSGRGARDVGTWEGISGRKYGEAEEQTAPLAAMRRSGGRKVSCLEAPASSARAPQGASAVRVKVTIPPTLTSRDHRPTQPSTGGRKMKLPGRNEASGSLVNFGFFLGLLAAKCGGGKGVN